FGLVSDGEYTNFISGYRRVGNEMVATINALSQRVNQIATQATEASAREHVRVQNNAMMSVIAVFAFSLLGAWFLSGMIVTPIQKLQEVMRKLAGGDLSVRADIDGDNEIAQLSKDVNQTAKQLHDTVDQLMRISEEVASAST
ncbi:methyl-accepting chemotaxis protein, partial [Vibrio harveyi]|uniref:HAMP domain-containing protein n=1 Tax=Vibrio harveyi TaxID=669 RepID=UPI001EFD0F7A